MSEKILIAGLGNPGKEYEKTRHNIGFRILDEVSTELVIPMTKKKFQGIYGKGFAYGKEVYLLKPQTFMNNSGKSVAEIAKFFKIDNIVTIHDDLDLPFGKIRIRENGSSAGHNGLKSIIASLGTENFNRIRFGIDKKGVLANFSREEEEELPRLIENAKDAVSEIVKNGITSAQGKFSK